MDTADRVDLDLVRPDVSNRIVRGFVAFLEDRHGAEVAARALAHVGLPDGWLDDEHGWCAEEAVRRFCVGILREALGVEGWPERDHPAWGFWREQGWFALASEAGGRVGSLLRGFASPGLLYRQLPSVVARANRITRMSLAASAPGMVELRVEPVPGRAPDRVPYCWNRIGFLEAIPTLWGLPRARVHHGRCLHDPRDPAPACVYRVEFRERAGLRLAAFAARVAALAALSALGASLAGLPVLSPWTALGVSVGVGAEGWWRHARARRREREEGRRLLRLHEETDRRYEELWNERQALRRALLANRKISGYLPAPLVEEIMRHPEAELALGGRRVRAAVLFVDVVGFTPRCEAREPETIVRELNTFFQRVDPVVEASGGVIDKRLGDGLMAVFPARGDDLAGAGARALRCAIDLLGAVEEANRELREAGSEPLRVRVGVAGGELVQGNLGSDRRYEYTVIGDVVNLASRLEGAALPGTVATQDALLGRAGLPTGAREIERLELRVKGRSRPERVVRLAPAGRPPGDQGV